VASVMSDPRIRVILVDDDPLVRAGLGMILNGATDIEIVGEAADGIDAVALADDVSADIVLMDIRMPRMDGLEATRQLVRRPNPPKVIVLTTFDADEFVARALADGAAGFLLKDTRPADIVDGVRRVARGEPILSPTVTAQLIRQFTNGASDRAADGRSAEAMALIDRLTEREREVAVAVGRGKSNTEIAAELYVSVATVKAYVSRVLDKLDASNRVQIAIRVRDAGLI
jgi:DNA-binding NarL/FixJ family response regulator